MTELPDGVRDDAWPFSKSDEVELLLARFYRREELDSLGQRLGVEWFETNRAGSDEETARRRIAESVVDTDEMDQILEVADSTRSVFDWFLGRHVVVKADGEELSCQDGPPAERWRAVIEEVSQLAGGSEKLQAFLRGIVEDKGTFRGNLRTDFSEVMKSGNRYYDEGDLWVTNKVEAPARVTGIKTWKTGSSGRGYTVAAELVPVIEAGLDDLEDQRSGPVPTPDQSIPDELDRRVPKFQEGLEEVTVRDEDVERFEEILTQHDALSYWSDYVAPEVEFRERAKKAVLCMLASPEDAHDTKGRTNAILYGPPGTGKSLFRKFLVEEFGGFSADGARVSKADLTYNKNTGEDGLLVRAHRGLLVLEEADELDEDALGAALTAFGEAGRIEIRDMRLPAEVRGILLGNYRSREEIVAAHSEALFDRFEFVINFERLTEGERNAAIDRQYDYFRKPTAPGGTTELKKYIAWVREFAPEIPAEELDRIKEFKADRIDDIGNVREGVSLMTVAYTIARLNLRDVTLPDYQRAFELVRRNA